MKTRLPVVTEPTVAAIAARSPAARAALQAHGIDLCCGGSMSLAEAARRRGLDPAALERAIAAAEASGGADAGAPSAGPVGPDDRVRAVLARHPSTREVFEAAGLLGCGGAAGPDEPIGLFAAVHQVDAAGLLERLNAAVRAGAAAPARLPAAAPASGEPQALYRPFLTAALVCTLTLGASFGADNLYRIHAAAGPVPEAHNWTHALFQVWGFLFLAIAGVSLHVLPRLLGRELAAPGLARATLWLVLGGLLVASYGRFAHAVAAPVPAAAAGAALLFSGVLAWACVLQATATNRAARRALPMRLLAAGTGWWLVAAALHLAGGVAAVAGGNPLAAVRYNDAMYAAALLGGALAWVEGMLLRTAPMFLGLRPPRGWWAGAAFVLGQIGAALGVTAGLRLLPHETAGALVQAGLLSSAAGVVAFLVALDPLRALGARHLESADPSFPLLLRLGFAGALLFALLASTYGALGLAGPTPPQLLYDGARHALALGFLTLVLFAMAGRVLPIFSGRSLAWPRARLVGCLLVAAGVLLREVQVLTGWLGRPELLRVSAASGFVAAIGVLLASLSLLRTLHGRGEPTPEPAAQPHAVALGPEANVAALVASHPEALAVLIAAGFTPLANPVLRRTLARAITLGAACSMHGIDVKAVLGDLARACPATRPGPAATCSCCAPAGGEAGR